MEVPGERHGSAGSITGYGTLALVGGGRAYGRTDGEKSEARRVAQFAGASGSMQRKGVDVNYWKARFLDVYKRALSTVVARKIKDT